MNERDNRQIHEKHAQSKDSLSILLFKSFDVFLNNSLHTYMCECLIVILSGLLPQTSLAL